MATEMGLGFERVPLASGISGKLVRDASAPAGFRIVVNALDPEQRQRFTAAHEIAHYVLHRDLIGEGVVDNALYRSNLRDDYERQADSLAAKILLPSAAMRDAYQHTKSYAGLAELFHASTEAIRIRLKELRLGA